MSEPFLGEIKIVPYNFVPRGWANCDGQLLPISQNTALFSLIGTIYGGDGEVTFAVPDLRGRFPMHTGNGPGLTNRLIGQRSGAENHALAVTNMPSHSHQGTVVTSTGEGDRSDPAGAFPARAEEPFQPYAGTTGATMGDNSVQTYATGSGTPFEDMPPFQVLRFIIALTGIFPSES